MSTQRLNKRELWARVEEILNNTSFKSNKAKEETMAQLQELLAPKGSRSQREVVTIDGVDYKSCRYTNRLWPLDELVYQNDTMREQGKDKGYSKIGLSLWTKGQNYVSKLKDKLVAGTINPDVNYDVQEVAQELKNIEEQKLTSDPEWLKQFATEEQLAELESKSREIEE